jgi:hypothetical protein
MTLQDWIEKTESRRHYRIMRDDGYGPVRSVEKLRPGMGVRVFEERDALGSDWRELWSLSDYVVTGTASGPSVFLGPRK